MSFVDRVKKLSDSFADSIHKRSGDIVYLVHGQDMHSNKSWHFLKVYSKLNDNFISDLEKGEKLELSDYGRVLTSGYGEEPPKHVITSLKEYDLI